MLLSPAAFCVLCETAAHVAEQVAKKSGAVPEQASDWFCEASICLDLAGQTELRQWLRPGDVNTPKPVANGVFLNLSSTGRCSLRVPALFRLPVEIQRRAWEAALPIIVAAGFKAEIVESWWECLPTSPLWTTL